MFSLEYVDFDFCQAIQTTSNQIIHSKKKDERVVNKKGLLSLRMKPFKKIHSDMAIEFDIATWAFLYNYVKD